LLELNFQSVTTSQTSGRESSGPPASRALSLYPMGSRPEWSGHHLGYPFFFSFLLFLIFFFLTFYFFFFPVPVPSCRQHSAGCRAIMLWRGFCTDSHRPRSYNIHFIQNCWMSSLSFISLFLSLSSFTVWVPTTLESEAILNDVKAWGGLYGRQTFITLMSFLLLYSLCFCLSFFSWRRRNSRIWHYVCKREIGGRKTSVGSRVGLGCFRVGETVDVCVSLLIETEGMKTKMYEGPDPGPVIEHIYYTSRSGGAI
jgi:hypothetical protein